MTMTNKEIQQALIDRGYDLGSSGADGDIGPKTIKAIEAFQKIAGLKPDSIPGEKTQAALRKTDLDEKHIDPDMPSWLVLASKMIGIKEGKGALNNPDVVRLFADSGFPGIKQDSVAWCAAYVNGNLERAGIKGSRSLMARSMEGWGVGIKSPVLGCIATKKRGTGWQGHTFFVVGMSADGKKIYGLGGNQNDGVNVATFDRDEIVAFRWPAGLKIPTKHNLPTTIAGALAGVREA